MTDTTRTSPGEPPPSLEDRVAKLEKDLALTLDLLSAIMLSTAATGALAIRLGGELDTAVKSAGLPGFGEAIQSAVDKLNGIPKALEAAKDALRT